jgi:hypothetical protein
METNKSKAPAPVRVGDVFATASTGDVVIALQVDERKAGSVWSVKVQPATEDASGKWVAADWEAPRWTSVKVYDGGLHIDILGRVGA